MNGPATAFGEGLLPEGGPGCGPAYGPACGPGGGAAAHHWEVRFESLFHSGRGLSFPCDAQGRVAWQALSESARRNYQRACDGVGLDYAVPAVRRADLH